MQHARAGPAQSDSEFADPRAPGGLAGGVAGSGLSLESPEAVLALQRSIGNAGLTRLLARRPRRARIDLAPPEITPAARAAANPLLAGMSVDLDAFYRGEMVMAEIVNPGKPTTIAFYQLKDGRLRGGIFSISIKNDPNAAIKGFSAFRSSTRQLARVLGLAEMELMGAAVVNPQVAASLERMGFEKAMEPLPEALGARPGEQIEVYRRRFAVDLGPAQQEFKFPATKGPVSTPAPATKAAPTTTAPRTTPVVPGRPAVQLELPFPKAGPRGGGGGGGGRGLAAFGLQIGLDLISIGVMNYVHKKIAENEAGMFAATLPVVERRAEALVDVARLRQRELKGKTMWVNARLVPVYWRTLDEKPYEGGEFTGLTEVIVESVTLSGEYRAGYTEGTFKQIMSNGMWVTISERRDALEFSFPFAYDPTIMTDDEIAARIRENERDATDRRGEEPIFDALWAERDALLAQRAERERTQTTVLPR